VECLTALVPHMVDCNDLEQTALACSDVQRRRRHDAPGDSWEALDLAIATQAVSSGSGREVALSAFQRALTGRLPPWYFLVPHRVWWRPGGVPSVAHGVARSPKPCSCGRDRAPALPSGAPGAGDSERESNQVHDPAPHTDATKAVHSAHLGGFIFSLGHFCKTGEGRG
jgi:hypothetical protein